VADESNLDEQEERVPGRAQRAEVWFERCLEVVSGQEARRKLFVRAHVIDRRQLGLRQCVG